MKSRCLSQGKMGGNLVYPLQPSLGSYSLYTSFEIDNTKVI